MSFQEECLRRFGQEREFLGTEKPVNKIAPLVSVSVTAYQHKFFINECLDGILMQKTDFPFEIIIGEDESKDGTREICIEYAEKNTDKIRLFLNYMMLKTAIFINKHRFSKTYNSANELACKGVFRCKV